ncbi:antibiotic biosynthesis monooxygenase [bacterium]|nr:antibiotic biosynthesis monooxygenase [bacterium]
MIARTWHGVVPKAKSEAYLKYLNETGVKDYRSTAGNRGVFVLRRDEDHETHYLFISLWDSLESIREFAGEDVEKACYYPKDQDFLLELEPKAPHYQVVVQEGDEL